MPYLLSIILLLLGIPESNAQSLTFEWAELYSQCIVQHRQALEKNTTITGPVYVEETELTKQLPMSTWSEKIKLIDRQKMSKLTAKGAVLHVMGINQLEVGNQDLTLDIVDFSVTRKGRKYFFINHGGSTFILIFNCEKSAFEISNSSFTQP